MIVKLKDGATIELKGNAAATGYVAEEITITDSDARFMWNLFHNDRASFIAFMAQFLGRFPSNRAGS